MRIDVDTELCCGSGQCTLAAPDVFDQSDDDGTVLVLDPAPAAELHDQVRSAAARCPSRAITINA